jgi:hypothetical protein
LSSVRPVCVCLWCNHKSILITHYALLIIPSTLSPLSPL